MKEKGCSCPGITRSKLKTSTTAWEMFIYQSGYNRFLRNDVIGREVMDLS